MTLVFSHQTAAAFHRCHGRMRSAEALAALPVAPMPLEPGPPDARLARAARALLQELGAIEGPDDAVHAIVARPVDRRATFGIACHVWSRPVPARSLLVLGGGLLVCDERFCICQAAGTLAEQELVEGLYELCGCYEPQLCASDGVGTGGPVRPRTSTAELRAFCGEVKGAKGSARLARALRLVRDGSRSPLETALLMLLVCPKRMGGLGLKDVRTGCRVEVPPRVRPLVQRTHLACDACVPAARLVIDYEDFTCENVGLQSGAGARRAAFEACGYRMVSVSRRSLVEPRAFERLMAELMRALHVRRDRLPEDFPARQESLRRFALRRWL